MESVLDHAYSCAHYPFTAMQILPSINLAASFLPNEASPLVTEEAGSLNGRHSGS